MDDHVDQNKEIVNLQLLLDLATDCIFNWWTMYCKDLFFT